MHILFLSDYFPPEVNTPATRLYEHGRQWAEDGHRVDVLTSVPYFPEGDVYDGYENRLVAEEWEGVRVTRVPVYTAPNEGTLKRIFCYVSFLLSAAWHARRLPTPDVVVATSPQFFAACAGYVVARSKGRPFVMEVRDLWPESIVAVGAMNRNLIIRALERIEQFLYRKARGIVVVTDAFKRAIVGREIPEEKIAVVKNGVQVDDWTRDLDEEQLCSLRRKHDLGGKFVVSYVGTIGMAHRADVLLEAARLCEDPDVVFVVVGSGARRQHLEARHAELQLPNFRLLDKVPRETVPYLLRLTDLSVVHLRDSPLFETVIPGKIFEAMAMATPVLLGVRGESREIVEAAGAGTSIPPEDPEALIEAVESLKSDPERLACMGRNGYEHVRANFDRSVLAREYVAALRDMITV